MSTRNPVPRYVYKVLTQLASPIPDKLPATELDQRDGFIHLSTAAQVSATVGRFYADVTSVVLIKVDYAKIKVVWEESKSHGTFPHIYDSDISKDQIADVRRITKGGYGSGSEAWNVVFEHENMKNWLVE